MTSAHGRACESLVGGGRGQEVVLRVGCKKGYEWMLKTVIFLGGSRRV